MIAGTVTPNPVIGGHADGLLLMVNHAGAVLWQRYLGYGNDEFIGSVLVDSQQQIVITGYTGLGSGAKDLFIARFDGGGNLINDLVIRDTVQNYALYGFDLEETAAGDYLIVGLGSAVPVGMNTDKYAFATLVEGSLGGTIFWTTRFSTVGTAGAHNTFTHILKVPNYMGLGERFLLSGATTHDMTGDPWVYSALIDNTGTVGLEWRYTDNVLSSYPLPAVSALYNDADEDFYVLHHTGSRPEPVVSVLGVVLGIPQVINMWMLSGPAPYNKIYNGMQWVDATQQSIVFSGYNLDPTTASTHLFSADFSTQTLNWGHVYPPNYDVADYQTILAFDPIVQPLQSLPTGALHQRFYQPNTLIQGGVPSGTAYQFSSNDQASPASRFRLSLINIDLNGLLGNPGCVGNDPKSFKVLNSPPPPNIPNIAVAPFVPVSQGLTVVAATVHDHIHCDPPPVPSTSGQTEVEIKVWPNPTSGQLYIRGLQEMEQASVALYDLQGRRVLTQSFSSPGNEVTVQLSQLTASLYFLEIRDAGEAVLLLDRLVKE